VSDYSLRWQGPWLGEIKKVPKGHEVLAEFPNVEWAWEGDEYKWIIRDPSGRRYIGATNHGAFYEAKLSEITDAIQMHDEVGEALAVVFFHFTQ
jgi:hypothetical protein